MVTYTKDELITSTEVTRNFSIILNNLKKKKIEKAAILRNNKMEAVILPILDYEKLVNDAELAEHIEIFNIIKQRESTIKDNPVTFKDVLKEYGISEKKGAPHH